MAEDKEEILQLIQKGEFTFEEDMWGPVSSEAKDLIKKLLSHASVRPSAEEALNHPWF
jgi:hypothetical protein